MDLPVTLHKIVEGTQRLVPQAEIISVHIFVSRTDFDSLKGASPSALELDEEFGESLHVQIGRHELNLYPPVLAPDDLEGDE
jgi:hypothetical protein